MKKLFTGRKSVAVVAVGAALLCGSLPLVATAASAASVYQPPPQFLSGLKFSDRS